MQNFLTTLIFVCLLTSFKTGEPDATLICKSESGRTIFTADFPSCSYLNNAELSIDGSKLYFSEEDKSYIVFDPDNKVFTVFLESKSNNPKSYKFLQFWALPATFKKVKSEKGPGTEFHDVYEFHGKVYATDPRNTGNSNTKTIELICTLDYQL